MMMNFNVFLAQNHYFEKLEVECILKGLRVDSLIVYNFDPTLELVTLLETQLETVNYVIPILDSPNSMFMKSRP